MTTKTEMFGRVADLTDEFSTQLTRFKVHSFNICHQYQFYRKLRTEMEDNEALVHIDFSENYIAKQSSAIQSAHFGASQNQITLHTGV